MSRKHYELLARALRAAAPIDNAGWNAWKDSVESIADALEHDNPRFDRKRFIRATIPAGRDNPNYWPK